MRDLPKEVVMRRRTLAALLMLVAAMTSVPRPVAGQSTPVAGKPWSPPQTSWGALST